ncbi:polysaccharide deacetylase family protein [Salipaludibacillus sp. HK11]|uniref:polysaccharide deacetylase family protein n=1 Tax=Salipaludibacillus sp. HK11 TaxID=3394320 RepID=UPI0039FD1149
MKRIIFLIISSVAVMLGSMNIIAINEVHANNWSVDDVQDGWWNKDKPEEKGEEEDPPELTGGPERSHRILEPVPMTTLQQLYPDTIFLRGPTTANKIALTFDDGPDPRFTPEVLDVLREYEVPATFFLLGSRAEAYPDLTTRIVNDGHVVGNHTFWHPDLAAEGEVDILVNEVSRTEEVLEPLINYKTTLFRPPYGFLYEELVDELAILDYSVIGWSVDSQDWQELSPEQITENVVGEIHPGAIILMHDGTDAEGDQSETIESLRQIIPNLQDQGYEFVTVPELLNIPYQR